MAKKKENAVAPEIHRIALPVSDESLVIDLPDGQKLVVGKLSTGSVIEVATWRGTGRPDSRTTRLMLGMSSSASIDGVPTSDASQPSQVVKPANLVEKIKFNFEKIIAPLKKISLPKINRKASPVQSETEVEKWTPKSPEESTSGEVDKWIEEVMARSRKKAANVALKSEAGTSSKPTAKAKTGRRK